MRLAEHVALCSLVALAACADTAVPNPLGNDDAGFAGQEDASGSDSGEVSDGEAGSPEGGASNGGEDASARDAGRLADGSADSGNDSGFEADSGSDAGNEAGQDAGSDGGHDGGTCGPSICTSAAGVCPTTTSSATCSQDAQGCWVESAPSACGTSQVCTAGVCTTVSPPRQTAPLSTALVTSQQPTFHWSLATGTTGAEVEICSTRACGTVLQTFTVTGSSGSPHRAHEGDLFLALARRAERGRCDRDEPRLGGARRSAKRCGGSLLGHDRGPQR